MCLVVLAQNLHPQYPLIVLANRDEFHARPASPMHWWDEGILAGRDDQAGGTWLAANRYGDVAVVTNFRERPAYEGPRSRGQLPFLSVQSDTVAEQFARTLPAAEYSGFNLLVYKCGAPAAVVRNRPDIGFEQPSRHVFAVSNGPLANEWPKMRRSTGRLEACIAENRVAEADLLSLLTDRKQALDDELPETGVEPSVEKFLSSPFIVSDEYGTRASTLVFIGLKRAQVIEHRFDPEGRRTGRSEFAFDIEAR